MIIEKLLKNYADSTNFSKKGLNSIFLPFSPHALAAGHFLTPV